MQKRIGILLVVTLVLSSCESIEVLKCANGEPVTIVKDLSRAYPVYASSFTGSIAIAAADIAQIVKEPSISGSIKTEITKFRQDLDQESSRLEMRLKTSIIALQTTPCDAKARESFWALQKAFSDKYDQLSSINNDLSKIITSIRAGERVDEDQILKAVKVYSFAP